MVRAPRKIDFSANRGERKSQQPKVTSATVTGLFVGGPGRRMRPLCHGADLGHGAPLARAITAAEEIGRATNRRVKGFVGDTGDDAAVCSDAVPVGQASRTLSYLVFFPFHRLSRHLAPAA
jgi:hypothetical protein